MIRPAISPAAQPEKFRADASKGVHVCCFALFLICILLVWLKLMFGFPVAVKSGLLDTLLILSAAATTVFALARQLPGQSVLLASVIIITISGVAETIGVDSGVPFGPFIYTENAGPKIFNLLPWSIPVLWLIVIFNSRGIARLILRPWRKSRLYGFRLIGVTAVLSIAFNFALEPFATRVKEYWLWRSTKLGFDWQDTPPSNFLGWLMTALIILAFATPSLINKSHQKFPPDYHPLIVWILLALLFASGEAQHHLWLPLAFTAVSCVLVIVVSVRGARW